MNCECGNSLNEGADFCSVCGKKAVQNEYFFCTNCGNKIENGAVFCSACGNPVNAAPMSQNSSLIMSLEGLSLFSGKQPIGILKIFNDKVEFVHGGKNFTTAAFLGGAVGGMIASASAKETDVVDCFYMSDIAVANRSKHPLISSYIEIVLKNGSKMKYLDRAGKYKKDVMFAAVDAINSNL